MIIPVTKLPSNFKPYPFKSFKMKAITLQQAIDLNKDPSLKEITNLIQVLVNDEIDASILVPIDVKYLIAMLSFHAFPKQTWTLDLVCPHCNEEHKQPITMKDFPPVPSLEDNDPYPLTIDDGTHIYELGYPTVEAMDAVLEKMGTKGSNMSMESPAEYLDLIEPYVLAIDGSKDGVREKLLSIEDFGVLGVMLEAIQKYFADETYSQFSCPKCKKQYKVPLSAVEVTQYTPFLDTSTVSKYKVNFRL